MEALQQILREQGNEATSVDLEYKQIDDLTPLLPLLAQFSNLEDLNLHGNRLKYLPEELGMLESLMSLDISNNMFEDLVVATSGGSAGEPAELETFEYSGAVEGGGAVHHRPAAVAGDAEPGAEVAHVGRAAQRDHAAAGGPGAHGDFVRQHPGTVPRAGPELGQRHAGLVRCARAERDEGPAEPAEPGAARPHREHQHPLGEVQPVRDLLQAGGAVLRAERQAGGVDNADAARRAPADLQGPVEPDDEPEAGVGEGGAADGAGGVGREVGGEPEAEGGAGGDAGADAGAGGGEQEIPGHDHPALEGREREERAAEAAAVGAARPFRDEGEWGEEAEGAAVAVDAADAGDRAAVEHPEPDAEAAEGHHQRDLREQAEVRPEVLRGEAAARDDGTAHVHLPESEIWLEEPHHRVGHLHHLGPQEVWPGRQRRLRLRQDPAERVRRGVPLRADPGEEHDQGTAEDVPGGEVPVQAPGRGEGDDQPARQRADPGGGGHRHHQVHVQPGRPGAAPLQAQGVLHRPAQDQPAGTEAPDPRGADPDHEREGEVQDRVRGVPEDHPGLPAQEPREVPEAVHPHLQRRGPGPERHHRRERVPPAHLRNRPEPDRARPAALPQRRRPLQPPVHHLLPVHHPLLLRNSQHARRTDIHPPAVVQFMKT